MQSRKRNEGIGEEQEDLFVIKRYKPQYENISVESTFPHSFIHSFLSLI